MTGATQPSVLRQTDDVLNIFKNKLAGEWKAVACCRHDDKSCGTNLCKRGKDFDPEIDVYCCRREYYRREAIAKWMLETLDADTTNGMALLSRCDDDSRLQSPHSVRFKEIENPAKRCLIVFAILVSMNYGWLIGTFSKYGITDARLDVSPLHFTESLREDIELHKVPNASAIIEEFDRKRFLYNVQLPFEREHKNFHDKRWIMPYGKRQPINFKGGTAQVWQVSVPEAAMPEPLKYQVQRSVHQDSEYGKSYALALKTFSYTHRNVFYWESRAYQALRDKNGMVQYLGEYEIQEESDDSDDLRTYNILLEFGELDLIEFFGSPIYFPPNLNAEIRQFWRSMYNVAEALKSLHHLEVDRDGNKKVNFAGWHADLKPDNILRVHGEFKLADFGFAKFKRKDERTHGEPTEVMRGGTETYGAPEADANRRGRDGRGTLTPVTRTIDTWSFGCVLSISATWVVLGYQGILSFEKIRKKAIQRLHEKKKKGQDVSVPKCHDAFHDGRSVLPEVTHWHKYLRRVLRRSDTITEPILNLVDTSMLCDVPGDRCDAKKLCDQMDFILKSSAPDSSIPENIESMLLELDRENAEEQSLNTHRTDTDPDSTIFASRPKSPEGYKSRRINRAIVENVPHGLVAHRQDLEPSQPWKPSALAKPIDKAKSKARNNDNNNSKADMENFINRFWSQGQHLESVPAPHSSMPDIRVHNDLVYHQPNPKSKGMNTEHGPRILPEHPPLTDEPPEIFEPPLQSNTQLVPDFNDAPEPGEISTPPDIPYQHIDGNWEIFSVLKTLEDEDKRAFWKRSRSDGNLEQFLRNRDIMFVIDNSDSMKPHWEHMRMVLKALSLKIGNLDKDGLDLEFTKSTQYNVKGAKTNLLLKHFENARKRTMKLNPSALDTDMTMFLSNVFRHYLQNSKKAMTLIVLTDGVWAGTTMSELEENIINFLQDHRLTSTDDFGGRKFTIQFVSFGQNPIGLKRLQDLDDCLKDKMKENKRDVIDVEHVSGNVDKMILGSLNSKLDDTLTSPSLLSPPSSTAIQRRSSSSISLGPRSLDRQNTTSSTATARSKIGGNLRKLVPQKFRKEGEGNGNS